MKLHSATSTMLRRVALLLLAFVAVSGNAGWLSAEESQHPEVQRFASQGRANLSGLPLACGRSAKVTVTALCVLTGENLKAGNRSGASITWQKGPPPGSKVMEVIEIPAANRGAIRFVFETDDPLIRQSVEEAAAFLTRFVAKRWLPTSEIRVRALSRSKSRAYASDAWGQSSINLIPGILDVQTAVHELGHHVEMEHSAVLDASKRFLKRRGHGERAERLRDLSGDGYDSGEIAVKANWARRGGIHYSGKFYGSSIDRATATELISTGLERLQKEPEAFFKSDADYFLFLLLTLQAVD